MSMTQEEAHHITAYKNTWTKTVRGLVELSDALNNGVPNCIKPDNLNPESWAGANWNWFMRKYQGWGDVWCQEYLK